MDNLPLPFSAPSPHGQCQLQIRNSASLCESKLPRPHWVPTVSDCPCHKHQESSQQNAAQQLTVARKPGVCCCRCCCVAAPACNARPWPASLLADSMQVYFFKVHLLSAPPGPCLRQRRPCRGAEDTQLKKLANKYSRRVKFSSVVSQLLSKNPVRRRGSEP